MARIRTIKPEIWTDEKFVALSPLARLLFMGLLNFVDDEGRAQHSPARFKMQILPSDSADVPALLGEIRREGMITVYVVDGKEYLQVCNFAKHQKVDKRTPSKLPPPTSPAESPRIVPTEGIKEGIKEGKEDAPSGASASDYFFETGCIRLNERDFRKWEQAFTHLELRAELISLAKWASEQKDWFFAVSGALAKRNREIAEARKKPAQTFTKAQEIYRSGIV